MTHCTGVTEDKPAFVYHVIETLLPESRDEANKRWMLMELYVFHNCHDTTWWA
jgi:hypothetical protein